MASKARILESVILGLNEPTNPITGRIVRWEVLKGLPGDGPIPKHFHTRRPTPWAEGFVVQFWESDGTSWIGNFQGRQDWNTKVLLWPEADSLAVLAMDNFYLVDAYHPESYVTLDSLPLVDDVLLGHENKLLFVVDFNGGLRFWSRQTTALVPKAPQWVRCTPRELCRRCTYG